MMTPTHGRRSSFDVFQAQLQAISDLRDGWDGSGSLRPGEQVLECIDRLNDTLRMLPVAFTFTVDLAPRDDGGVQLEWRRDGYDFAAEVSPDCSMYFYKRAHDTKQSFDRELPAFDASALTEFLQVGELV